MAVKCYGCVDDSSSTTTPPVVTESSLVKLVAAPDRSLAMLWDVKKESDAVEMEFGGNEVCN